jgi:FkbM family methyltransferase
MGADVERDSIEEVPPEVAKAVRILHSFASTYPQAFFIQVGTNDGVELDPLATFVREFDWRGIMVEPVPYIFERLRRNVAGLGGITLENVAIADTDGRRPFYTVEEVKDPERESLPSSYDAIGSFHRDSLLSFRNSIPDIEDRIVRIEVPCLSFETLCRKHGVGELDLLLIDVEGYDGQLLRSIDFSTWRPRMLIFEHEHLPDAEREMCYSLLEEQGYELLALGLDTWCLLHSEADDGLSASWREVAAT